LFLVPGGVFAFYATNAYGVLVQRRCMERALVAQKAMQFDCLKDDCPGFDPDGPDSPCGDGCKLVGGKCCPDPESAIGYTCYSQCAD
jgi:hypothetical protein